MACLARWCFRHRIVVVVVWLAVFLGVFGAERAVGSSFSNSFSLPGTESSQALQILITRNIRELSDPIQVRGVVQKERHADPESDRRAQSASPAETDDIE